MGEGLALEPAIIAPPRKNISLLAEQKESITGAPPTPAEGGAMAVGSGAPPTPVPAGIAKTQTPLELDDDMMDDVGMLADMQRGERFDVQANAATAAAGLTTNRESCDIQSHHVRTFRRRFRSVGPTSIQRARPAEETSHLSPLSL